MTDDICGQLVSQSAERPEWPWLVKASESRVHIEPDTISIIDRLKDNVVFLQNNTQNKLSTQALGRLVIKWTENCQAKKFQGGLFFLHIKPYKDMYDHI